MSDLFGSMEREDDALPETKSMNAGIELAEVVNIKDPKNRGRVKCKYITSDKDAGETGWIYCLTPFGGKNYGTFFHPNVGDIVALAYQHGDIHRPFVIGSLWTQENKAPLTVQNGKNEEYQIVTPNKSTIDLVDTKGKEKIIIKTPKNCTLKMDDAGQSVELTDGKNALSFNGKTGAVELNCDKKLTIKVGKGVTITCDGMSGAVTIDAKKSVDIKAVQYQINGTGTGKISANGTLSVQTNGVLTVKGSMTKIN